MISLMYPDRGHLCKEYFISVTGEKISYGYRTYESFVKTFSIKDPVVLDYYYIYLIV